MAKKCLVTGGAGFIGSHLVDALIKKGYNVTIFDNLSPQVHPGGKAPAYLNKEARLVLGDIREYDKLKSVLSGQEIVFHFAAAVGVGQSQYQIKHYIDVNEGGTANLLDIIVNNKTRVEKIIVAASMSSYGEGNYFCVKCGIVRPLLRSEYAGESWDPLCPECAGFLEPRSTDETAVQYCNSIYSISKKNQEDACIIIGKTYGISVSALRFFNVYGPRQSLSNPYTGVAAIFMSRIKNNNMPVIYEDGNQTRDFVSVHDIVKANLLAMEKENGNFHSFNIGSGEATKIKDVAALLAKLYDSDISHEITRTFRKGDVRHCYANMEKAKKYLGFEPGVSFSEGMRELVEWSREAYAQDSFQIAQQELVAKGIV